MPTFRHNLAIVRAHLHLGLYSSHRRPSKHDLDLQGPLPYKLDSL